MSAKKLSADEIKRVADRAERADCAKPTGRPTDFTETVADQICERIANGESLRAVCRDETMPAQSTVFRWLSIFKPFSEQYTRAREAQAELMADEIVGIADGEPHADGSISDVQRDRLRVDARKWVAAKLLPKKYGDKVVNEHSGPGGGAIPVSVVERRIVGAPKKQA